MPQQKSYLDAYNRGERLKKALAAKYPEIGLTFGYIGNLEYSEDYRSWMYFTQVLMPPRFSTWPEYPVRFSYGGSSTEELDKFIDDAEKNLENWIVKVVLPHVEKSPTTMGAKKEKTKKGLEEDGKLHELFTGQYYATRKDWIAGLDDGEVQLALYLEIIDMYDATGEEQYEDYPFAFEYEIMVAYPGPEWMAKVERSTSPAKNPEMALETSHSYGGGVPVTHKMLGIEGGGMDLKRFTAEQMTWKKEKVTHGTVAAQRGPGYVFRYPMFATEDDAFEFAEELFKTANVVMGVMIGFILDGPINMMGNTGWETIQEQAK